MALIGLLAYLYYRYLKKNDQGLVIELQEPGIENKAGENGLDPEKDRSKQHEEVEIIEGSEERVKKQSELEKGLENRRFEKLRFRGNSTYFCWELMKRTGIIEG